MQCQTCGDPTSPEDPDCRRCGTPFGQPPVLPNVPTYPVRGLGTAAAVAVGAATVLYLPGALFPLVGVRMARVAGEREDRDLVMVAALAEVLLGLPYALAVLVAGVLVIIWTWRARTNLDAFPGALPSLGAGWAIAGWLVPLANLVVPARMVANVARDSLPRRTTPALVGVWWAAWLAFTVGDILVARDDSRRYERLTEWPRNDVEFGSYVRYYQDTLDTRLLLCAACLVAGVSFIVLLRWISAAQQDRIARAAPAWPGHPGWSRGGVSATSPQLPPGSGGTIGA
ncbi:hypothetical protein TK50_06780 [Micromonospora haikouensis]|uniref:DUF4328 domain-containing protein n=1 Tax=Micromonospora haikouensis TaxID=686309 RepID=A0A0D0X6V8_9ACTN|nr:hypothetical protein TK50_06780 [Micromonospora haikouensis]